jgi:hypothetical protein
VTEEPLGAAEDVTVVQESAAARDGLFGLLVAVLVAALVRGFIGAHTTAGRIAVATIFGALVALVAWGWLILRLGPTRLEVSEEAIRLVNAAPKGPIALLRAWGDDLAFIVRGRGRFGYWALMVRGTDTVLPLRFFNRKQVKRACLSHGWRFGTRADASAGD